LTAAIVLEREPRELPGMRPLLDQCPGDPNLCFQCGKCTAGCPVSDRMDMTPTQVVHAVRLGQRDRVLASRSVWLCISCHTCSTRCPQGVDPAGIMDAARIEIQRGALPAAVPLVAAFHRKAMKSIRRHGRLFELGVIAGLKMSGSGLTRDMGLGMKLVRKGKIGFFPSFGRSRPVKQILRRSGAPAAPAPRPGSDTP